MSFYDQFNEHDLITLQQRAQRAASVVKDETVGVQRNVLTVIAAGETYALPDSNVLTVHHSVSIVALPNAPYHVAGIANVRGQIRVMIDLAATLGLSTTCTGDSVIMVTEGDVEVGLRVDDVGEVSRNSDDLLMSIADTADIRKRDYVRGIYPDGSILLNLSHILRDPALMIDQK